MYIQKSVRDNFHMTQILKMRQVQQLLLIDVCSKMDRYGGYYKNIRAPKMFKIGNLKYSNEPFILYARFCVRPVLAALTNLIDL